MTHRRRWLRPFNTCLALLACGLFLAGCAAGAPTVASNPTATVVVVQPTVPPPTITRVGSPEVPATPWTTGSPLPLPSVTRTTTPKPKRPTRTPTVKPTPRPDPPPPAGNGLSRVFDHGTSGRREVALTFDAGADRGFAEQILDTLRQYGVIASFGITGHWASENPDLVKRMVADGHMLFNHTYSHKSFTGYSTSEGEAVLTREARQKELRDTADTVRNLTGYELAPYFRPPYGDYDDSVLADVADAGYWVTLMYNCDTLGWNGASVDDIVARCGENPSPGEMILLHVGSASLDAKALPRLIETLRAQGYAFVTAEQLLQG